MIIYGYDSNKAVVPIFIGKDNKMLKVYTQHFYVSINGKDWELLWPYDEDIKDESEIKAGITITEFTFEEAVEALKEDYYPGLELRHTFFRKKPYIHVYAWPERYICKNDTLKYMVKTEIYEGVGLNYIMKRFSAEDCIKYLKERGLNTCPMEVK